MMIQDDFFRSRLDQMVDPRNPLVILSHHLPWEDIERNRPNQPVFSLNSRHTHGKVHFLKF